MFTNLSVLETLEYVPFSETITNKTVFLHISSGIIRAKSQKPTLGNLMVAGLQNLRPYFGTYEQFVSC